MLNAGNTDARARAGLGSAYVFPWEKESRPRPPRLRGGTEASPRGARARARERGRLGDSRAGSSVRARRAPAAPAAGMSAE